MTPDPELLRRYVEERSQDAFSDLVRSHVGLVFATALRLVGGDAHRAKDVTQTVFLDLARKAKALLGRPSLAGWLHTSARFAAAKAVRSEVSRRRWEMEAASMESEAKPSPGGDQLRNYIDELIDSIGADNRELVLLRYFEERSFAEIGTMLGLSEEATRKRVERAIEKLRLKCRRRGIVSTSAALGAALQVHAMSTVPETVFAASAAMGGAVAAQGTATALTGIVAFMSLTKVQIGIAAALLVGALGTIEWQRESEASIRRQLGATVAELDRIRTDSTRQIAQLQKQLPQPRQTARPAAIGIGTATKQTASVDDQSRLQSALSELRIRYARFIRKFGLTPDQGERLVELLAEKQLLDNDLRASAMEQGMAHPKLKALIQSSDVPINQDIQNLLAPEAYSALGPYDQSSLIQSAFVGRLANRFSDASTPLNEVQTDQLTALVQANFHFVPISPSFGNETTVDWENVGREVGNFLTPDQVQVFRSSIDTLAKQQAENIERLKGLHPN